MSAQEPPDDRLLLACRAVGQAMDRFDESAARVLGVGRTDLRALNLLENGPLGAAGIADQLGLTRASVTALVDRLENAGHVSRTPSATDRRAIIVELEPATWHAFAQVYRPLGDRLRTATRSLDEHDRDVVVDVMVTMIKAFDDARYRLEDA